ncbi:MAG: PGF-pre-PGF domain-containing protein [Nanoarchaeota archaeon]
MKFFKLIMLVFALSLASVYVIAANCWDYTAEASCIGDTSCSWHFDYYGSWCENTKCWNFQNETSCDLANTTINMSCTWMTPGGQGQDYGWCESLNCPSFQGTNATFCVNNSQNLSCSWDADDSFCYVMAPCSSYLTIGSCLGETGYSGKACAWNSVFSSCYESTCSDHDGNNVSCLAATGCTWNAPFCQFNDCWNNDDENSCNNIGCSWRSDPDAGWCEEPMCWQYDNISLNGMANESVCVNNTAGINCTWIEDGGWCDPANFMGNACGDFTSEMDCITSNYCFWDYEAQACNDPGGDNFFQGENPGCYIFNVDSSACENALDGCEWNAGQSTCDSASSDGIDSTGIQCINITNSTVCNQLPMLSTCCQWSAGACTTTYSTTCWDQMQAPPMGANFCEDYNAYNNEDLCIQIAGPPWYMPCSWDSSAGTCGFNTGGYFGQGETAKITEIDNNQGCTAAGGQWITETYCDGTSAVPVGRCERKFDQETNCNKACYACEKKNDGTEWTTSVNAQTACEGSERGCDFKSDTNAPNGFGVCKLKDAIKTGQVGECSSDCSGCTYMNNPQVKCQDSNAGCKWDEAASICVSNTEKICTNACDRCYDEAACLNQGRGGGGACTWSSVQAVCNPSSGSAEICWNGMDDDDDDSIDCEDTNCFGDMDCGGGGGENCFAYSDSTSCGEASGCTWFEDAWGTFCEYEGALCWQNDGDETACTLLNDSCGWFPSGDGGQCEINWTIGETCWQQGNNATACDETINCTWIEEEWGSFCEHDLFAGSKDCISHDGDEEGCNLADGCTWFSDPYMGGWCDPDITTSCQGLSAEDCAASDICKMTSGWCDPLGFGGGHGDEGGFQGMQCFIYNGDETGCTAMDGCSYFSNPSGGFCDIGKNCSNPDYHQNQTLCEGLGCAYATSPFNECYNPKEICFRNMTLQQDPDACNARDECNWTSDMYGARCEPTCFQNQNANDCSTETNCIWLNGFCESEGAAGHFEGMEGGAAMMVASDTTGETTSEYVDLIGLGMKDMSDQIGIGAPVVSLVEAAACNGKIVNGVSGQGTKASKAYFYLDTDGSTTGNCALKNDAASAGYEFYFKFDASYTNNQVSHTVASYRCNAGSWVVADISANTMLSLVCQEIGGYMIAVTKSDLAKFTSLYDPSADIRIYAATANSSGNITNVTDTVGPGYVTLGAIDFTVEDFGAYGSSSTMGEGMMKQGYISYEDCYNSIDDDNDGKIDCDDYNCGYELSCAGIGVNAPAFVDSGSPLVTGITIETYPTAASIVYHSNKPANGTVRYYHNDSTCGTLNATIADIGITSEYAREFKTWHYGVIDSTSIGYALSPQTTYYYKLEVCDNSDKCAVSKCSSFKTSASANCKYCNFVLRLKTPSGWYVMYDHDNDEVIDHVQGQTCGPNAGFKMNNSAGRNMTIYLLDNNVTNATNVSGIIFHNVFVTKSALNQKVREFDTSGSLIAEQTTVDGSNVNYAGLPTATRDKIINNLFPEKCTMRLPKVDGSCPTTLWHCDDALTTCTTRNDTNLTNETSSYCDYNIPYCQFSIYSTGNAIASVGNNNNAGGGGGGGGGGAGSGAVSGGGTSARLSWQEILPGGKGEMNINSSEIPVYRVRFTAGQTLTTPGLTVRAFLAKPETLAVPNAKVFKYMEFTPENMEGDQLDTITVDFSIPRAWMAENNVQAAHVVMFRYNGADLQQLETTNTGSNADEFLFSVELPGFSYFAIAAIVPEGEEEDLEETIEDDLEEEGVEEDNGLDSDAKFTDRDPFTSDVKSYSWVLWLAIVVFLAGAGLYIFALRRHRKGKGYHGP